MECDMMLMAVCEVIQSAAVCNSPLPRTNHGAIERMCCGGLQQGHEVGEGHTGGEGSAWSCSQWSVLQEVEWSGVK
jgi:hypothetical protein